MWQSCFWRSSLIVNCLDKCITGRKSDETVDDSLVALKHIPDWFVTSQLIKNLLTSL